MPELSPEERQTLDAALDSILDIFEEQHVPLFITAYVGGDEWALTRSVGLGTEHWTHLLLHIIGERVLEEMPALRERAARSDEVEEETFDLDALEASILENPVINN